MNRSKICPWTWWLLAVLFSLTPPLLFSSEYHIHIFTMTAINVLIASGLRVIMTTGLVSFAHAAFVAIGGYTSALVVLKLGWSSWVGLLLAPLVAVVIAVAFGLILLRLKGAYFFIATTAFGEIVLLIFTKWTEPFGGAAGLSHIPVPSAIEILGLWRITFDTKASFYYQAVILTVVVLLITHLLEKGRLGAIWTGIEQSEQLCQSVGINIMLYKVIAFAMGCSMAAVAGAVQAHYFAHVHPGGFGFSQLVNYLTFVMIGGSKSFLGPLIGAGLLTTLSEFLRTYESLATYQAIIYGIVLVLSVMFFPEGLVSLPGKLRSWRQQVGKMPNNNS